MSETTGVVLRQWLVTAVRDLGGSAPRADVHARVRDVHGGQFSAEDALPRRGRPGQEAAWRNNLDSLYDKLKKQGVMESQSRGGPWRLSPEGLAEAAGLPFADGADDLLRHFRPKDSGEYLARLQGRTLRKNRLHESLLRDYGTAVSRHGWQPLTTVHPRDLELRRATQVRLAEVKVVYDGNATQAVRGALAQLLEYRHFFYPTPPGLLALFSEPIGDAHVHFLSSLGVDSVWRAPGGWDGVDRARDAGLVPGRDPVGCAQ